MMNIANNIKTIRNTIPKHVKLVCVSKFHPQESIIDAYNVGERCFGENRPQEMAFKAKQLPNDIQWHFIGNLQSNKVKQVVPVATLIESVSSLKLINEIEYASAQINKTTNILLEVHVAKEESKQGFTPQNLIELITPEFINNYPHLIICGIMGMATHTDNQEEIKNEFKQIVQTFNKLKEQTFKDKPTFKEISMGMSDDYQIAIKEGATIVRIGSSIFGPRQY